MRPVLRLLWRFIVVACGFAFGCLAASVFVHIVVVGGIRYDPDVSRMFAITSFVTVPMLTMLAGYTTAVPAVLLIVAAEAFSLRDWLWNTLGGAGAVALAGAAGMAAGARGTEPDFGLIAVALAAGLVGGFAYWLIAGRNAGAWAGRA